MSGPEHNNSSNLQKELYRQILYYLSAHPDSKDTVEGILKWWLPSHPIEWDKEQLQEALNAFVARGWLVKRMLRTSQELYSMNQNARNEIKVFLKSLESKAEKKDV